MFLLEAWEDFLGFIETGGDVLWILFAVTLAMWALILERFWFLWTVHPKHVKRLSADWEKRADQTSWYAQKIRMHWISDVSAQLSQSTPMIRSLVSVCPLLGLLGTVMGMLEVFDVMSISGNGNIRAMAAGVSRATVSTMAGMVAALSGLYFSERLTRRVRNERRRIEDMLCSH